MTPEDIALTLLHGIGPIGIAELLERFGSAESIFAASEADLVSDNGLRADIARAILRKESMREAEKEIKYIRKHSIKAIASTDPHYPALLRECPDYPHVLYVLGDPAALSGRMLGMVGTRTITPYGQRMCDILVGRMAELDPALTIVSGLAYGVDGNCHRAALRYGLPTVAVIANPLPEVTPTQHRELAEQIIMSGGAIVTELHSQTKQNGAYFIPRNRIIAGMSEGTVVVESPLSGGSLSTATLAAGYNRVVMAVPGRAGDRASEGANQLIKQRQASMVCSGSDIFYEMGWDIDSPGKVPKAARHAPVLSGAEEAVLECFNEGETVDMDRLAVRSGFRIGELAAILLGLEMAGLVRSLPGKMYEKV